MYLNERAWEIQQDDPYRIHEALKNFLYLYAIIAKEFHLSNVYVPQNEEIYLRSRTYSIQEWLAKSDIEYRRLYLSFWQRRILYKPDEEYEASYHGQALKGGTEAVLNHSFMISICFNEEWKQEIVHGRMYSLKEDLESDVEICNVFSKEQLLRSPLCERLKSDNRNLVASYDELWEKREIVLPYLRFCPSVEKDLKRLESTYFTQVIKKLCELNSYCEKHMKEPFQPHLLSKTTPESEKTLELFPASHTFTDERGEKYLASWHMRFTGISGRIFFVPNYQEEAMLICYIGEKLPNANYPT